MKKSLLVLMVGALLFAATPARADHSYIGTAESKALELSILPPGGAEADRQGLLIGYARSVVTSAPAPDEGCDADACAEGTVVGPLGEPTVTVEATDEPKEENVTQGEVPQELSPVLDATFGVANVSAAPAPGPSAGSTAEGANVDVHVVSTVIDNLPPELTGAVAQVIDDITETLGDLLGDTPQEIQDIGDNVDTLLTTLQDTLRNNPIVDVDVQDSEATTQDSPADQPDLNGITIAEATANGATVKLLPGTPVATDGLFIVEVGQATARATTDQQTATISSQGAIATVSIADLTTLDPDDYQQVPVESGQGEQCFGEAPLLLCVLVGGSSETTEGASSGAVAAAVQIKAFADADPNPAQNPLPGVTLSVAAAEVGVNAAPPGTSGGGTDTPQDDETPDVPADTPEEDLPSTGGGLMVPGIALLGVGALGLYVMRRRRP